MLQGGNAPFILFYDANLDAAVDGALLSKFPNNGQTCDCANRIYVYNVIYDTFAEKRAENVVDLSVDNGAGAGVVFGPLINAAGVSKATSHIADTTAKAAAVTLAGKPHCLGGTFYEPKILTGVTPDMAIATEETFGSAAACSNSTSWAKSSRLPMTRNLALRRVSIAAISRGSGGCQKPWNMAWSV